MQSMDHPLLVKVSEQAHLIGCIRTKMEKPTTPANRKDALQAELCKQLIAWKKNLRRL